MPQRGIEVLGVEQWVRQNLSLQPLYGPVDPHR
jgi:hypothetical protein